VRSGREAGVGPRDFRPGPDLERTHLKLSGRLQTASVRRGRPPFPYRWSSRQGNRTGRRRRDEKGLPPGPARDLHLMHREAERRCDDPTRSERVMPPACRVRVLRHRHPHEYNPRPPQLRRPKRIRAPRPGTRPRRAPSCLVGGVLRIETSPKVDGSAGPVKLSGLTTSRSDQPETRRSRASSSSRRSSALTSG
jgi:hypothetical protein